ncbi:MAG: heme exporter protein CcmB [Alphaproteobacteria bacterium]|nr:heme exporter protein CcmB [Alphaproteobacteria bacterium]
MKLKGAGAAFLRELKLAWSGGGGAALPLGFFAAACSLTPLTLGPESDLLKAAGPGVIWIALALSSLLPMERLFQADLEDGTLDAYAGSGVALEGIAAAKTAAHWVATGLPLALVSPVLWIMLQGPVAAAPMVALISAIGSAAFFFFGAIGAALAAGVRRGGLLIALVALPLYSPAMIFGAAAMYAAAAGGDWGPALMLTAAAALFGVALSPFAAALALRAAID